MSFETNVDAVQKYALGTRVRKQSTGNEYIYLKGVTSTAQGTAVGYDEAYVTQLADSDTPTVGPIAIACAAVDAATKFGWYCIVGKVAAKVLAAFADNGVVGLTSTGGSLDDAAVGHEFAVHGAIGRSAIDTPTTGQAYLQLLYPFVTGAAND